MEECDLCYRKVTKNCEEEKETANKRKQKANDKLDGGKSVISHLSDNTNKTSAGNIKRHCEPCEFKRIANWTVHKNKKHNGVDVPFEKCLLGCVHCKSKYRINSEANDH